MPPLRILHVVPYFEHAWAYGGIPRVATTLTHGLARRGHDVTVCTTDACDADLARARSAHAARGPGTARRPHVPQPVEPRSRIRWQLFTPIGFVRALARARSPRIDIGAPARLPQPARRGRRPAARRARGVPYVVSPHGTAPLIERRLLAKRIFDATAGRGYLEGAAQRPRGQRRGTAAAASARRPDASRITLLPNPIDEREFEPPPDGAPLPRRARPRRRARRPAPFASSRPARAPTCCCARSRRSTAPTPACVIAGSDMDSGPRRRRRSPPTRASCASALLTGRDRLDALAAARRRRLSVAGRSLRARAARGAPRRHAGDRLQRQRRRRDRRHDRRRPHRAARRSRRRWPARSIRSSTPTRLWRQRARVAGGRVSSALAPTSVCDRLDALYRDVLGGGTRAEPPHRMT